MTSLNPKGICKSVSPYLKVLRTREYRQRKNSFPISFQSITKVARSLECLSLEESALSEPDGVKIDGCECNLVSLPT